MLVVEVRGERFYACSVCGLLYESRELAGACEAHCSAYRACNPRVAVKAVGRVRLSSGGLRL